RPEPLTLSAVYPQHRQASRPVQAFIEFLRERLESGVELNEPPG
ncbi:LysR family transcriptional regulator, partial [Pseudomonas savastanoi pv. glycinea str. race 4]